MVDAQTNRRAAALVPTAERVGFTGELDGVDTAADGLARTDGALASEDGRVPVAVTVTVVADGDVGVGGGGGAGSAGGVSVDTANTASVVPEAKEAVVAVVGANRVTTELINGARSNVGGVVNTPDAFGGALAGTFEESLARNGEAAFGGNGDEVVEVQGHGDVRDGEGADDTGSNVGRVVGDGGPLGGGIDETVLVGADGRSERLSRGPLREAVNEGRRSFDDGDTGAILDCPEVDSGGSVVVPNPDARARKGFGAHPALSLDRLKSDVVVEVVGGGEASSNSAEHHVAGAEGLSGGVCGDGSGSGEGLDEGLVLGGEEGLVANGVGDSAGDVASRRGAEAEISDDGVVSILGGGGGSFGEGGEESARSGVEVPGSEDGAEVAAGLDEEFVLAGLEAFEDTDGDAVDGVEGLSGRGQGGVAEGLHGGDVGEEGVAGAGVGSDVLAGRWVLVASSSIGVLAKDGNAVSGGEFAEGVGAAGARVGEGGAGLAAA